MDYFLESKKDRPPTAVEIPARFDILSSCDDILKEVLQCDLDENGLIDIPYDEGSKSKIKKQKYKKNLFIDISSLEDRHVDSLKEQILKQRNFIFGLRLSAPRLTEDSLLMLLDKLLPAGVLNYLVELDLSYLSIPNPCKDILCKTINTVISGYCPIKRLILTRAHLGVHGGQAIWKALDGNIFIEEVIINGNRCTDIMLPALVKCLSHSQSRLRVLGLGSNDITPQGMRLLGPAISKHDYLEEVLLNDNPIGDEGVNSLFKDLRDTTTLTMVNLSRCGIKKCEWGAKLRIMLNLRNLFVGYNNIDDDGFTQLCDGLLNCVCLRHLDLSFNRFGGEICKVIGQVLKENPGLLTFNLSGNEMHQEVWNTLGFSLNSNRSLNTLDLRWCGITQKQAQQFCSALADNSITTILLDMNPISYVMRNNPREWNPEVHKESAGVHTLGHSMIRDKDAPTLREMRRKVKASKDLQAATGVRLKAAALMERLEMGADPLRAHIDPHDMPNPIQRSDIVVLDKDTFMRKPAILSYDFHAKTLETSRGWREARLKEINESRAVVGMMHERGKSKPNDNIDSNKSSSSGGGGGGVSTQQKRTERAKKILTSRGDQIPGRKTRTDADMEGLSAALSVVADDDDDDNMSIGNGSVGGGSVGSLSSLAGLNSITSGSTAHSSIDSRSADSTMHITPSLAGDRARKAIAEEVWKREADAGRRKILSVAYGNRHNLLGSLEVLDSTTYTQAKEMILPLLRDYLTASLLTQGKLPSVGTGLQTHLKHTLDKMKELQGNVSGSDERMQTQTASEQVSLTRALTSFKILDWQGQPVLGHDAHIRCVWSELSHPQAGMYLMINPADAITSSETNTNKVPDYNETIDDDGIDGIGGDCDEDGDTERRADAYD